MTLERTENGVIIHIRNKTYVCEFDAFDRISNEERLGNYILYYLDNIDHAE